MTCRFEIVIHPAKSQPGRFVACLGERVLHTATRQPLLDCARILLGEGADPTARIEMRHAGAEYVALSSTIGAAARLTVKEPPSEEIRLVRYQPYDRGEWRDGSPYSDLNGEPVPDIGSESKSLHGASLSREA